MNTDNATFAKRSLIATLIVLSVAFLLYMGFLARVPLMWIGIAAFLAVAINPMVHQVARFMPRRNLALAALLVIGAGVVGGLVLLGLFLTPLLDQTIKLVSSIPDLVTKIANSLTNTPVAHSLGMNNTSVSNVVHNNLTNLANSITFVGGLLISTAVSIINGIIAVVAIISLVFFMTVEERRWKQVAMSLVPTNHTKKVGEIGQKVYRIINGYVVGNVILSLIFGLSSALVLWIMKSPYFLPLGLAVGLIDLIPLVGSTIGATLVALISVLSGQYWTAAVFIIFTLLYVQLENNVLNPAIYSKNVDISPLIVLASILIGGAVAGIIGALLAIPVAATLQVIARELLAMKSKPSR
jgi:predicted PurR-regulated permease PerM